MWARARRRKQEWQTGPVLREEMVQKGEVNSTQETEVGVGVEVEVGVGVTEKEMGRGRETVEAWLVACSCWAGLRRFG